MKHIGFKLVRKTMRYLLVIAIGFLFCWHANAQDNTILDQLPVLEPADVFVNGVEIVETLPELNTDGLSNIYFLASEAQAWELVPPPDAVASSANLAAERLRNGNFELYVIPLDISGPCPSPTPSFEFDPTTRHFTLREQEIQAPELWRYWMLSYSEPPENLHLRNLCQMDTVGGADLPDDMSDLIHSVEWQYGWYYGEGMYTPEYFIVPTRNSNDAGDHLFTIYTIAEDTWSESFPLALPGDWTFTELAFADGVLYFRASGEAGAVYYALDIANQTFTELFRNPHQQYTFNRGEHLYYYIGHNDTHYQFYQYDLFAQHETIIAELPCADLTGNCVELHLKQSNGYTDRMDWMFALTGPETEAGIPYFVVDVTTAELLYSGLFPSQAFSSRWLDHNEPKLLIHFYRNIPEPYALLVDLSADNPAETQVVIPYDVEAVSPDERRAVVYVTNEEKDTKTIGVIDLQTLAYQPITLPIDTSLFGTWVYWQADGDLQVNLYSRDENITWYPDHPFILRTWIVRP